MPRTRRRSALICGVSGRSSAHEVSAHIQVVGKIRIARALQVIWEDLVYFETWVGQPPHGDAWSQWRCCQSSSLVCRRRLELVVVDPNKRVLITSDEQLMGRSFARGSRALWTAGRLCIDVSSQRHAFEALRSRVVCSLSVRMWKCLPAKQFVVLADP